MFFVICPQTNIMLSEICPDNKIAYLQSLASEKRAKHKTYNSTRLERENYENPQKIHNVISDLPPKVLKFPKLHLCPNPPSTSKKHSMAAVKERDRKVQKIPF